MMKNRKIKLTIFAWLGIVSIVMVFSFSLTGCYEGLITTYNDSSTPNMLNDAINNRNTDNTSEVSSSNLSTSSAQKVEYPSAIELMSYTPNQLIAKYGKTHVENLGENACGNNIITLKKLPNIKIYSEYMINKDAMDTLVVSVEVTLKNSIGNNDICPGISLGMTKKEVEKYLDTKLDMYDASETGLTEEAAATEIKESDKTDFIFEDGIYPIYCTLDKNTDDGKIISAEIDRKPEDNENSDSDADNSEDEEAEKEEFANELNSEIKKAKNKSDNTTYVINDNIATYVAQHQTYGKDSLDKDMASEYGKIDAMYAIGLVKYDGLGASWTVRTKDNFIKHYPNKNESYYNLTNYYKALLDHFGVSSKQSFMMPIKYSIANSGGAEDLD